MSKRYLPLNVTWQICLSFEIISDSLRFVLWLFRLRGQNCNGHCVLPCRLLETSILTGWRLSKLSTMTRFLVPRTLSTCSRVRKTVQLQQMKSVFICRKLDCIISGSLSMCSDMVRDLLDRFKLCVNYCLANLMDRKCCFFTKIYV